MKNRFAQCSAAASLLAAIVFAPTAIAQTKCDNPRVSIDQRACAKAAESIEALHLFVWRTRMIWDLNMANYAHSQQPIVASVTRNPQPREAEVSESLTVAASQ